MTNVHAETERLRLRDWEAYDERPFHELVNTPGTMRLLGGMQTREQWHEVYQRLRRYSDKYGHSLWIVEDRTTGALLGFCGLKRVDAPAAGDLIGRPEIGWRLREDACGKGIAKEAAIATLDLAFNRFEAASVVALTSGVNVRSLGLMLRLGMQAAPELDFRDDRLPEELNPIVVYCMPATAWPVARQQASRPLSHKGHPDPDDQDSHAGPALFD